MKQKHKIKNALQLCSDKQCDKCFYNRWIYGVCQKHLCKDALALINEFEVNNNGKDTK